VKFIGALSALLALAAVAMDTSIHSDKTYVQEGEEFQVSALAGACIYVYHPKDEDSGKCVEYKGYSIGTKTRAQDVFSFVAKKAGSVSVVYKSEDTGTRSFWIHIKEVNNN
jgi:hypothetical protein